MQYRTLKAGALRADTLYSIAASGGVPRAPPPARTDSQRFFGMHRSRVQGFTLIELMVTVAVLGILTSIALPSYSAYVQRSRVPVALDALSTFYTRMEQRYQDVGNYAAGENCAVALPAASHFSLSCALADGGQGYTATATGDGPMAGYAYTIDEQGGRATTAHPKGTPATACWSLRGTTCDS